MQYVQPPPSLTGTRHWINAFPAGSLFPVVKKYLINYSKSPSEYVLPVVPCGNVYLLFTLGDTSKIMFKHYARPIKPCLAVGGHICREQIQVHCNGHVEFIFAELHPVALYYLYKRSVRLFTDRFTPIDAVAENELKEKILHTSEICKKLCLIKNFLEMRLPMDQILQDTIFRLTQWIEQHGGQVRAAEMAQRLGISERQLERIFLEKMGVSPKYYAKMIQMRQAINLVMANGCKTMANVVYENGHYDASHFNKDFKRFLNMNPRQFMLEDSPLLKQLLTEEIPVSGY